MQQKDGATGKIKQKAEGSSEKQCEERIGTRIFFFPKATEIAIDLPTSINHMHSPCPVNMLWQELLL